MDIENIKYFENIVNLFSHELSIDQARALSKGLSFSPKIKK